VALSLAFSAPSSAQERQRTSRVDSVFAVYDNTRSPGCAVGVIQDGEFIFTRGYGMANLDLGVPIAPTSVFRIGSTSKQFTAASVVLLALEGKLSLEDDVRRFLPELPDYVTPITIRHLLNHTSGIRDYLRLMFLAGKRDDDFYTEEDALSMISRQEELNFTPGNEFLYSNSGYFLLSQIVARVSGTTLREYAAENIFRPLGMTHTHFHDDHNEVVPDRASGYAPTNNGSYRISMTTLDMVGDGGVFTTVEDLRHWDANFYDQKVGGGQLVQALLERGVLNNGDTLDYALGLSRSTYRRLPTVRHGGAFVGFRAEMLRFPTERFTVICLCNSSTTNPSRLANRVADIFLDDRLAPVPTVAEGRSGTAAERAEVDSPFHLSAAQVSEYIGSFHSNELGVAYHIDVATDTLRVRINGAIDVPLEPRERDVFSSRPFALRFTRDGTGQVDGFLLDAGRVKNLRFTRVPD
jgi:CubicO group peptidase (beta-lactamase class C family)